MWCSCSQHCGQVGKGVENECGVHVPSIVDRWGRALRMIVVMFMFLTLWIGGEGC